MKAKSYIIEE